MIIAHYASLLGKIEKIKAESKQPLTLVGKTLYAHIHTDSPMADYKRGEDYVPYALDKLLCRLQNT